LAPDPDREGEAIAWHIASEIGREGKKVHRVLFNEITKRGVIEAMKSAGSLNRNKFEAQQARRILDRLVGYQISPILWDKVKKGLSAGRVQSVAVRLICEREAEIRAFVQEEYWTIHAVLEGEAPPPFEAKLTRIGQEKAEIKDEKGAREILELLDGKSFKVLSIEKKEKRRNPAPPFITSRLQQEASRKLRFSASKTMKIAQRLYEGKEIGEGELVGLITYMRTDSTRIAEEALHEARDLISDRFGPDYLPTKPRRFRSRKGAQDAHEAIRPTSVGYTPEKVKQFLDKEEYALYELIWKRFIASQMNPALFDAQAVDIEAGSCLFRATGSVMKFPGFIKVYQEGRDDEPAEDEGEKILPELKVSQVLDALEIRPEQHFTQPLPRFTDATLIRELEEKGIGRPSTYATILGNIQNRKYVLQEKRRFRPTDLGILITDLLVENFPDVLNVEFTASMEEMLDLVEEGKKGWVEILEAFYQPFKKDLDSAKVNMRDLRREGVPTDIACEKCGKMMSIRWGSNGEFLACSGYPECRNTGDFNRDEDGKISFAEPVQVDEVCDKCGSPMTIKRGRFGEFLACTGYPECRNTMTMAKDRVEDSEEVDVECTACGGRMVVKRGSRGGRFLACEKYPKCRNTESYKIGVKCPQDGCDGDLVERSSKKGKIFFSCSRYPDCKFASWNKPVEGSCPKCGSACLVERVDKSGRNYLACPEKGCRFKKEASEPPESEGS
ncbi:type I DNA topoisomerase, partial [Thermodesulfobacteriota bacterium]